MIYNHLNSEYLSSDGYVSFIKDFILSDLGQYVPSDYYHDAKRRRTRRNSVLTEEALWDTPWGKLLRECFEVVAEISYQSKVFRRRFRIPFAVFKLLLSKCKKKGVWGRTIIPYEFRILIGLRILGRGNCADDISEMSGVGESTVNTIFKDFCSGLVDHFYDEYVFFPEGEELQEVQEVYGQFGFPGACGSMDVTHLPLGKCPEGLKVLATGKEKFLDHRYSGLCMASLANSPRNCVNITTNRAAKANCCVTVSCDDVITLRCNVPNIAPHEDLLWCYGNEYIYPE